RRPHDPRPSGVVGGDAESDPHGGAGARTGQRGHPHLARLHEGSARRSGEARSHLMTADDELCFLSLAELGSLLRARTVSPVEAVGAPLDRIARLNPTLNAFVTVMAAEARAAARRVEDELRAGRWRGPLHGVPIGLKDIFDTAGVRTTHGSSFYRDNVPREDA